MEMLHDLKDSLMELLESLDTVKEHNPKMGEVEAIDKITHAIKNINKICEDEGGYSQMSGPNMYGHSGGYSGRGRHYVRGHYSGNSYGMNNGRGMGHGDMARNSSYGNGREEMIESLYMAEEAAKNEQDREKVRRLREQLERG